MQRVVRYNVEPLGAQTRNILQGKDLNLVDSYLLGSGSFTNGESRLDVTVYDLNGNKIETFADVNWYSILGTNKQSEAQQIQVDPVSCVQKAGYSQGDVILEYDPYDFLFYRGASLYISDISTDRTEIRVKSLVLSDADLRQGMVDLYKRFNEEAYFSEAYLDIRGQEKRPVCVNAMLETIGGNLVATLKLYEPLPTEVVEKDTFEILLPLGEPVRYQVTREETWEQDPPKPLSGPNFNVDLGTAKVSTEYISYGDLLSSGKRTGSTYKQSIDPSVDYNDFGNFVHFSSAVERLENARYKFEMIWSYEQLERVTTAPPEKERYRTQIQNIIANFDHYERFLYFEKNSYDEVEGRYHTKGGWPKTSEGTLLESGPDLEDWWTNILDTATAYDQFNVDILADSIPHTLRDNEDNDPYTLFVHMIGQHFDDIWIYINAIAKKYDADNRLGFGVSKDLVKQAIHDFGIDLYESNESLTALFELSQNVELQDLMGDEYIPKTLTRSILSEGSRDQEYVRPLDSGDLQPTDKDTYNKELWKRIYHNIPTLIKAKGTNRGLRVLINCFGIPDDILDVKVAGGINREVLPFFGPEEFANSGSVGMDPKVRIDSPDIPVQDYIISGGLGVPHAKLVLTQDVSTHKPVVRRSDDSHHVEVGFNLNKAAEEWAKEQLPEFNFDDVFGDPGNREEDYGKHYKQFLQNLYAGLEENKFRTPAAIIRLVRYFDAALFRSLADFIAARATVSTGAIVRDHFMHRSRWAGVMAEVTFPEYSGSIEIGDIAGSSGRSLEDAGSTKHTIITSNGQAYIPKDIDDESPWYNGELSGSYIEVTDGWLTKNNPHNKKNRTINYKFRFFFMDLPEPPYCIIAAWDNFYQTHVFYIRTDEGILGTSFETYHPNYTRFPAEHRYTSRYESVFVEAKPRSRMVDEKTLEFIGWYKELEEPKVDTLLGLPEGGWLSNPRYREWFIDSYDRQQALYRGVTSRIRLRVFHAGEGPISYHQGHGYYNDFYYNPGDLVIIIGKMSVSPDGTISEDSILTNIFDQNDPFDQLGDLVVLIETKGGIYSGTISGSNLIGSLAKDGFYTVAAHVDGVRSQDDILRFGFAKLHGGPVGGYLNNGIYVNADWFDTWHEWSDHKWVVDYKYVQWYPDDSGIIDRYVKFEKNG